MRTCAQEEYTDMIDLFGSGNLEQGMCLVYLTEVGLEKSTSDTAPKHARREGSMCSPSIKWVELWVLEAYRTGGWSQCRRRVESRMQVMVGG